jgi:hypothetical protein
MDAKRATYTGNSGERRRGQCLPVTRPEVVLHTWLVHLVWIKEFL